MIKVIEAISDTNIGGAGILLVNRLRHSDRKEFYTVVAVPENSKLIERLNKIKVKSYAIKSKGDKSFSFRSLVGYCVLFSRVKPDIVNSHGSLSSRVAAALTGVPIKIYTRHCVYPLGDFYKHKSVRTAVGIFTDLISDKVIAVADSAKKNLIDMGISENKIKVIINGAEQQNKITSQQKENLRRELGISETDVVVTICARLEACKDHKCFLKAASVLRADTNKYKFLIMGSGSLEKELKEYSNKLGVDDSVIFLGFVEDTSPYMNITDINVNCSIGTETSSLALSEGMSLGIPAVVSNYGGNPYMVKNRENGYVYTSGNHIELAKFIKKIADFKDKNLYIELSRGARNRFINELNAKSMTEKTERFYKSLCKNKKPRR